MIRDDCDPARCHLQVPNIHSSPLHSLHFVVFKNYSLLLEPTEPSRAIDLRMRALRVDPSDVDLWFSLGDLAARHGDTVLAAEAFQLGLDRSVTKRQRALGLKGLALALYDLGDVEATLERLRSALEIDPGWENGAQLRRGIVAELLARDEARSGVIGRVTAVTASLPLADLLDQDAGPRAPLPERSMAQLALDIPAMVSKELEEPNFLALGRLLLSLHEGESESTSALEIIVRASNPESAPMEIPESPEPGPASPPPEEETPTTPRKRKTPADDDDRKVQRTAPAEDEGASSGEEEGKKKARRSGRTAKKVAAEPEATTVPGEAKKFALDESVEPEFLRRADLMLAPMSISFGSLNRDVPEYVSSVINRFLDVALGGWRRRGKKAKQADAPKATRRGDSSFTTPGPADPVWTDVGSLIDFVQSCTGKSLAEWSEAYLLRCLSAWTSCAYFEAMTEVVADLLARAEKGAVSFSDKLLKSALHGVGNQPALLLLSACELLVDQAANQMAEKVSSLVEVAVYPLLSLYTAKLDLLSLGGMDGLRRQWMQGKVRSMEGLIGEAGKAWEACLTGIGAGTLELANVRWDRHLSTQAIRSKMKGIEFRHRLEELDSAFQEKRFGEVLAGLGPMVGHGLASFSAGTDSSFSVADMEEFCSLAERIALLERFGTCVREQQLSTDLSWEVDVRLIGLLLDQLPNEGGTLDSLDKLIAAMSRLLNPLDSRTSAIAHLPAKDALASSILLANRLAVTMLLRWPEFVTQHAKPSPDKERLRRYSFSFVARAFRLLFHLAAAADPDPDEGTDPSSDWLDYCHQMMGARDVCDVDGSSILRLCLRRFRAAGADYADQVAQCYNCMYKVTLDPTILFEEHVTRPITLEKDSAEFVAGMVPRWREALVAGNSTTSERQHFLKTLEKVADALGDWASSPHVMQNLALLERFLAADVSLAEFAGQVATPPLISASALRSGGDPVPVAAFEIDYIRGCLVSMQVDPARFPLLPVEEPRDSRSMPSHRAQAIHMLAKEAIPMLKRNAAINWELFEAWWALGAAYAQLAWDLLGLENSHELSAIEDDIADYQKVRDLQSWDLITFSLSVFIFVYSERSVL